MLPSGYQGPQLQPLHRQCCAVGSFDILRSAAIQHRHCLKVWQPQPPSQCCRHKTGKACVAGSLRFLPVTQASLGRSNAGLHAERGCSLRSTCCFMKDQTSSCTGWCIRCRPFRFLCWRQACQSAQRSVRGTMVRTKKCADSHDALKLATA